MKVCKYVTNISLYQTIVENSTKQMNTNGERESV
jgi:hypothetical protein